MKNLSFWSFVFVCILTASNELIFANCCYAIAPSSNSSRSGISSFFMFDDNCSAVWNSTINRWEITSGCKANCSCSVPASSTAAPAASSAVFGCVDKATATSDKFYLELKGTGTGIHDLVFDKSSVEMFKDFAITVMNDGVAVWEVDATWMDAAVAPSPSPGVDINKEAAVILRCDTPSLGDIAQTYTFDKGETTTCTFGHWKVKITYLQ